MQVAQQAQSFAAENSTIRGAEMNQTRLGLIVVLGSMALVAWIVIDAGLRLYGQLQPANYSPFIVVAALFFSGLLLALKKLAFFSARLSARLEKNATKNDRL